MSWSLTAYGKDPKPPGHSPLLGHGPFTTGPRKQWANTHTCMHILTCASDGLALVHTHTQLNEEIELHEHVHMHCPATCTSWAAHMHTSLPLKWPSSPLPPPLPADTKLRTAGLWHKHIVIFLYSLSPFICFTTAGLHGYPKI